MSASNSQRIVPTIATHEMLVAASDYMSNARPWNIAGIYSAMLEAAPKSDGPADDSRDAARYRAIKNMKWETLDDIKHRQPILLAYGGTTFDQAVDAEIARQSATEGGSK